MEDMIPKEGATQKESRSGDKCTEQPSILPRKTSIISSILPTGFCVSSESHISPALNNKYNSNHSEYGAFKRLSAEQTCKLFFIFVWGSVSKGQTYATQLIVIHSPVYKKRVTSEESCFYCSGPWIFCFFFFLCLMFHNSQVN